MVKSPYDTSFMTMIPMVKTIGKLEMKRAGGQLPELVGYEGDRDFRIWLLTENDEDIPVFYQPAVNDDGKNVNIYIDARGFKSAIDVQGNQVRDLKKNDSVTMLFNAAVLSGIWIDKPTQITGISTLPMLAYASLISEALSRRVGLDPSTAFNVMVTFQAFYSTRSMENIQAFGATEKLQLALALSKSMSIPQENYMKIIDEMTADDLVDFTKVVDFIRKQNWSPRLSKISAKDIFGLVMNNWIGVGNPRETIAAAIEYPPLWTAICYHIGMNNYYQKLPLGQIIKRLSHGNALNNFLQQVKYLLR